MRKSIAFLTTLILSVLQVQASVIYVNLNATGNNDGSSWANGYNDFQAAINASVSGDSIFVATAVYQPASGSSYTLKEGVKIFGGFLGVETGFTERNLTHKATLQGNGASVIVNNNNGLTAASVIDGFIITGGNNNSGGGGAMDNTSVSLTIRNCVFSTNTAQLAGAIHNYNASSPTIINCVFSGNSATSAGGGAIYNMNLSNPVMINCIFSGNTGSLGGAIYNNFNSSPVITNCVIYGNTAGQGGAMYNFSSNPIITNTIIWDNIAYSDGNGMFNYSSVPIVSYSDMQDGAAGGNGNISLDPLFTDAANGDYSLKSTSPCINAGTPDTTGLQIGNSDIAGELRIAGTAIDMGAYEFQGATVPVQLSRFTGILQSGIALLQWESGVENHLSRYLVEKSPDAISFVTVGNLMAKGSNSQYSYSLPQNEGLAFYRIQMVDDNGNNSNSNIIRLSINGNSKISLSVYPNPAEDYIYVNANAAGDINIYNTRGRLIKTEKIYPGLNKIKLRSLNPGIYFIRSKEASVKFIKR